MIEYEEEDKEIDFAYLELVVEEAAEVIQAIMKLRRFGIDHKYRTGAHKGETNIEALTYEIGDLLEVIDRLNLSSKLIEIGRGRKCEKLEIYSPDMWYPGIEDKVDQ